MRKLEPEVLDAVKKTLSEEATGSAADNLMLHQAEIWRDRLIADDDAAAQWITQNPGCDSQELRALIRQARKDAKPAKPGALPRHGRAYREIFQMVREQLGAIPPHDHTDTPFSPAREAS
jgi:ribosome-associated protein